MPWSEPQFAVARHGRLLQLFSALGVLWISGCSTKEPLREASGVVRIRQDLVFVGDESAGKTFSVRVPPGLPLAGAGPFRGSFTVDVATVGNVAGPLGVDLESLDVLPSGSVAVLSERLRALVVNQRIVAEYPGVMGEIGGKGLEGLSVRSDGKLAALWEGGHFEPHKLPTHVAGAGNLTGGPMNPIVCVHDLPSSTDVEVCPDGDTAFILSVPATPDTTQAFRAPDLVWSRDGEEFIVLLSSTNAANNAFRFKWLQRFSNTGTPIGEPVNLCARGLLPDALRSGRDSNFEGLAWFDEENLVLINDYGQPATAVLIDVVPWPSTSKSQACDAPLP